MNEQQAPSTPQPEIPSDVAQAASVLDEVLALLPKTREEHNRLSGHLRTLVSKIMDNMNTIDELNKKLKESAKK